MKQRTANTIERELHKMRDKLEMLIDLIEIDNEDLEDEEEDEDA